MPKPPQRKHTTLLWFLSTMLAGVVLFGVWTTDLPWWLTTAVIAWPLTMTAWAAYTTTAYTNKP